ncbi:MAG: hypothetical protein ACKOXB_10190 [Flavobacteriales bacterium]
MNRNEQFKKDRKLFFIILLVGIPLGVILIKFINKQEDVETDKYIAYRCAMNTVDGELVAPSQAKYAEVRNSEVERIEKGVYKINSYVDAPNRMGVMVRLNFSCVVKLNTPEKDRCVTEDLYISEN